ncbi:MAG: ferritin-like domain-containing protein [Byssovorax sp.]
MLAPLTAALTGTRIETEYRAAAGALARVRPSTHTFDASAYEPRAVARARALWSERMVNEYTSTTVFSALASQLVEANATLDTTAVTLRMAHDELVHAEACAAIVVAMGGVARSLRETDVATIARHPGCGAEERALRNVIFTTCLSEMNSVAYFIAALDRMTDPYLRDLTRQLLADEVLHGSFGFAYLEAWSPFLEQNPAVRDGISSYLRFAFAVVEREFGLGEHRHVDLGSDDHALGVVAPGLSGEVFRATMKEAVVPGLSRFGLAAEDAWQRRALG